MERSLGDPPPTENDEPAAALDPADYDVAEYAAGIRPGQRSVMIQPRPDLYPNLQRVVRGIQSATDDADVDDLIDEYERIKAQMLVEWVVERRSPEWVKEFYAKAAEELEIEGKNGATDVARGDFTYDQAIEVSMRMILAQTLQPAGWDLARLRDLYKAAPEQLDLLADAVAKVNAGHTEELTLDFSQRRSTNRGTRRSSTS